METKTWIDERDSGVVSGGAVDLAVSPGWFGNCRNLALSALALVTLALPVLLGPAAFAGNDNEHWVGTWGTALHQPSPAPPG